MVNSLKKRRITVVLEKHSGWDGSVSNENDMVLIENENGAVQDRKMLSVPNALKNQLGGGEVRITWKRAASIDFSAIKPQLSSGLTVYMQKGNENRLSNGPAYHSSIDCFIETPLNFMWHSETWDGNMLSKWLTPEIISELNYSEHDYDINIADFIRIDEYYNFNDTFNLNVSGEVGVKTEMGIFSVDTMDANDINMSGVRCTWDVDDATLDKCAKTFLFLHPFHVNGSTGSTSIYINEPAGLHPSLTVDLRNYSDVKGCSYFAYFLLPKDLFVDQFQSEPIFLFGEHDLELPEYAVKGWGSVAMFELQPGSLNDINLHSRYVAPNSEGGSAVSVLFTPHVFLACDTGNEQLIETPFYSKIQGYESFFTPDTKFYHLNSTCLSVDIPKLDSGNKFIIEFGTLSVVIMSILFLMKRLFK